MQKVVFLFIVLLLLLNACTKNEELNYSLDDVWLSLGIVEAADSDAFDYLIRTDIGDTLIPVAYSNKTIPPEINTRVVVNYTILDDIVQSNNQYYVRINSIQSVLYKDIIQKSLNNIDSLGTDPINVYDIWQTNNWLNLKVGYKGGLKIHYLNLGYNIDSLNKSDATIILELLHNANNDKGQIVLSDYVTFNLDKLLETSSDSIEYIVKYRNYNEETLQFRSTLFK